MGSENPVGDWAPLERARDKARRISGCQKRLVANCGREMKKLGLVEQRALPWPASGEAYALKEAGRALEPDRSSSPNASES